MRIGYFAIGVFCAVAAYGQAIVEHSAATAGASTAAAGAAKGVGKSIGGVFSSLSNTLDKAGTTRRTGSTAASGTVITVSNPSKPSAKPVSASKPIDPSQFTEGLDRAELIKRFGEPVLQLSESSSSQLVERLWYNTTASDQVEIKLIDGKVASVRPPAGKKQEESSSSVVAPSSPAR